MTGIAHDVSRRREPERVRGRVLRDLFCMAGSRSILSIFSFVEQVRGQFHRIFAVV